MINIIATALGGIIIGMCLGYVLCRSLLHSISLQEIGPYQTAKLFGYPSPPPPTKDGLITYPSLCMKCIGTKRELGANLTMLTGYCIVSCRCDRCRSINDLAICKIETTPEVSA